MTRASYRTRNEIEKKVHLSLKGCLTTQEALQEVTPFKLGALTDRGIQSDKRLTTRIEELDKKRPTNDTDAITSFITSKHLSLTKQVLHTNGSE